MINSRDCILQTEKDQAYALVQSQGLTIDEKIDLTIGIYDDQVLVATGSLYANVLKMIAVDPNRQGENLTALVIQALIDRLNERKITKYFLYTKPEHLAIFSSLHFSLIIQTDSIALFENSTYTIRERLIDLKKTLKLERGTTASIVMNCNPVTKGHLYLIEKCASQQDNVIIFLVEENLSIFPFQVRYKLLKKATSHLRNVHILPSTPYIISAATFPTYFLKEVNSASQIFMNLDILIFKMYFMDIFNIDFRYAGTEPLDPLTRQYNETMHRILKDQWISIDRLSQDHHIISASLVRRLARDQKFRSLKPFVPGVTYRFLVSRKGKALFKS
jgi:[citrate (pro-3S)-lyase] ligase